MLINCHTGKDYFDKEIGTQFFEYTIPRSKRSGIPIYHEGHRGRILFAAHIAADYLHSIPDLRIMQKGHK